MAELPTNDRALAYVRRRLDEVYQNRLDRAVLFGSRARGDESGESDYVVAVFLNDIPDWWREMDVLADLRVEFFERTGAFLDAKPFHISEWPRRSALMGEIRRDGVAF